MNHRCVTLVVGLLCVVVGFVGCSGTSSRRSAEIDPTTRNPLLAQQLTVEGKSVWRENPAEAERLFHEAIAADLFHGPAHNNLGVLHLQQGNLYEAAQRFEMARKLMPGHPDPRLNLGLAMEAAGRVEDALIAYESALEVYPGHLGAMQALTACELKHGRNTEATLERLHEVAIRADGPEWQDWARRELAKRRATPQ